LGSRPVYKNAFAAQSYQGLNDYQDLFLRAIGDYYQLTGNAAFLRQYWDQIKFLVASRLATISPANGLQTTGGFNGPGNGTATSALTVLALQGIVPIANAFGDTEAASTYIAAIRNLSTAVNTLLWDPAIGTYSLSLSAPNNFSIMAIAYAIRAGIANASQAASCIAKLPELRLGVGFKDLSGVVNANDTRLSPNTQGFLLDALFIANQTFGTPLDSANFLLRTFCAQMVNQPQYYSGASWVSNVEFIPLLVQC
jgi:glycogen debranching enzyme